MPLSPLLRAFADRLVTAMMVVADALQPRFERHEARALLFYLSKLVVHLITIDNFGVPARIERASPTKTPAVPAAKPAPIDGVGRDRMYHRRGWVIAALPDIEPALADLRTLLADPSLAALLAADPALRRLLGPILRGLDITLEPAPPPPTPPPSIPNSPPAPTIDPHTPPTPKTNPPNHTQTHVYFVADTKQIPRAKSQDCRRRRARQTNQKSAQAAARFTPC